jgi:hypothetical protein
MKEYYSNITLKFSGNNIEAENKEQYIQILKEQFLEEYGIFLNDNEIEIIEEYK